MKHRQILRDIDNGQDGKQSHPALHPAAVPTGNFEPRKHYAADPAHELSTQDNRVEVNGTGRPAELAAALKAHQRPQAAPV